MEAQKEWGRERIADLLYIFIFIKLPRPLFEGPTPFSTLCALHRLLRSSKVWTYKGDARVHNILFPDHSILGCSLDLDSD